VNKIIMVAVVWLCASPAWAQNGGEMQVFTSSMTITQTSPAFRLVPFAQSLIVCGLLPTPTVTSNPRAIEWNQEGSTQYVCRVELPNDFAALPPDTGYRVTVTVTNSFGTSDRSEPSLPFAVAVAPPPDQRPLPRPQPSLHN
jgi:hypothetical protein